MKCIKCGAGFDDKMSACPECGAPAFIPIIPEKEHDDVPVIAPPAAQAAQGGSKPEIRAIIPETAEEESALTAHSPDTDKASDEEKVPAVSAAKASVSADLKKYKRIIAILFAALILMTVFCIYLIANGGLKGESSITYSKSYKLNEANVNAQAVYNAALDVSTELEMEGILIISDGVICSSGNVGVSGALTDDGYFNTNYIRNMIASKLGYGPDGSDTEWFVVYKNGIPAAAYAANDVDSKYIGSFPTIADAPCTFSFAEGKNKVNQTNGGKDVPANELY